ncbi:MAG: helix-turn-helix domain-containing protein [Myxococcota bacterium]|nr:helix-turn-helix domain-containing protein [Myxococcota bacterium]
MARRKGRTRALPLAHRLPNPSDPFVGREDETRRLARALEEVPVSVVVGPGGIGKTALATATLRQAAPDRFAQGLYLGVPPDEPVEQIRGRLLRLLADAEGSELDVEALRGEPEASIAAAIDLAEASARLVLLDDVHHTDVEAIGDLLTRLSTYARRSRWIATSRTRLPATGPRVVELEGMPERDLLTLAEALAPERSMDEARRAARSATGSPWLLQQFVAMGETAREVSREQLLAELPARAAAFLESLAVLRAPLPLDRLATFAPIPDPPTLERLARRGLVQSAEGGLRLHDVLRGLFAQGDDPRRDEARRRAAEALAGSEHATDVLEAARLWAELSEKEALHALLERRAEQLLSEGLAPRLWTILAHRPEPSLTHLKLRCAAELGNATALSAVQAPVEPDAAARFAWASTLYAQGEVYRARAEAEAALARGATGPWVHGAHRLVARCHAHALEIDEARAALGRATGGAGLEAYLDALEGDLEAIERARDSVDAADAQEAWLDLSAAYEAAGRADAADELLDRVLATPRGGRADHFVARRALVLRARLRLEAGELIDVAEIVDTVRPFSRAPSLLRAFVLELDAARAIAEGELEGIDARLEAAAREAFPVDARCHARVKRLAWELARERAREAAAPSGVGPSPEARELAARRGEEIDGGVPRERVVAGVAAAERALAAGQAGVALEQVDGAVREATVAGQRLLAARAMALACDAAALAGLWSELPERAGALAELAEWMSSERWRAPAELILGPGDPGTLERLAAGERVDPRSARRAQALLGGDPALDDRDRAVVDALRARTGLRVRSPGSGSADWEVGWGLDERTQSVWLEDGRTIALASRSLLWRVLVALADEGGEASKEHLVLAAWGEREYHPGRHDAKLHVSIRKLRQTIEDDASRPTRLLTLDDGYRLGGVVRRAAQAAHGKGA